MKGVGICLFVCIGGMVLRNRHPAPRIPDKGCLRLYNLEELFDIEGKFIINKEEGENRALLISATGVGIIIQTGYEKPVYSTVYGISETCLFSADCNIKLNIQIK